MPISNLSNGLRTGVCTSTNRPTTPYEGQHIYETDTDIEYVWSGTAWVVNYVSAASPTFTGTPLAPTATAGTNTTQLATTAFANTAGGLVYVTSASATSGTSLSINNCFTSTYNNYRIVISNLTSSTSALYFRLRASATDSTANYYFNGIYMAYSSTTINGYNGSNLGYYDTSLVGDTSMTGGIIEVFNPQVANLTSFTCIGGDARTGGGGARSSTGFHNVSTSYDGFTVYNATFTNITVAVYGYRKA